MKKSKVEAPSMKDYEVEEALRCIERAAEVMADEAMLVKVRKLAEKRENAVSKFLKQKPVSSMKDLKERAMADDDQEPSEEMDD